MSEKPQSPVQSKVQSQVHVPDKGHSAAQRAVDRAISDLRRGSAVVVGAADGRAGVVVVAAEFATDRTLPWLIELSGSAPRLVMTGNRARALTEAAGDALTQSLALAPSASADWVRALADPTAGLGEEPASALKAATVVAEGESSAAAVSVRLAKYARLLPTVLAVRASGGVGDTPGARLLFVTEATSPPTRRRAGNVIAADARVPLADAEDTRIVGFRPLDGGNEHLAIVIGSPSFEEPVLARMHSQCVTGDLLGSLRCDCGDQLRGAIKAIAEAGGGVLLYLAQEGRDIGILNKLKAYTLQDGGFDTLDANEQLGFDADERMFLPAARMFHLLGIARVRLMTNNPDKVAQLAAAGIEVSERVAHSFPPNPHNARYLSTKAERAGHLLGGAPRSRLLEQAPLCRRSSGGRRPGRSGSGRGCRPRCGGSGCRPAGDGGGPLHPIRPALADAGPAFSPDTAGAATELCRWARWAPPRARCSARA